MCGWLGVTRIVMANAPFNGIEELISISASENVYLLIQLSIRKA